MKISELFQKERKVFSFEIFPPKRGATLESITSVLGSLSDLKPDFMSVTYGAGGNSADASTCQLASMMKHQFNVESMAHLTCVNSTRQDIDLILKQLNEQGIENILALRGDINPDLPKREDFHYASELVAYIKQKGEFHLSGACYPEVHMEAANWEADIEHLKYKVDAGVNHLITQLFFENDIFFRFYERIRKAFITVPIQAGIMPVVNKSQIERMVTMCGASIPTALAKLLQRYEYDPISLRSAGIEYAIRQIEGLVKEEVQGIHLYTMNQSETATQIAKEVRGWL